MRILVCGGRNFIPVQKDITALLQYLRPGTTLIHGGARGADTWAASLAKAVGEIEIVEFPPDWAKHGTAAGPVRNQKMIDAGRPDVVIAFPGGPGTADMIRRAKVAKIQVIEPRNTYR